MGRPIKRSISIAGHATSISIEEPFWDALRDIAAKREMSLAGLIAEIDAHRDANLSSAIRLFVLGELQSRLQADGARRPDQDQ